MARLVGLRGPAFYGLLAAGARVAKRLPTGLRDDEGPIPRAGAGRPAQPGPGRLLGLARGEDRQASMARIENRGVAGGGAAGDLIAVPHHVHVLPEHARPPVPQS